MNGRVPVVALWVVAVLALALGATGVLMSQGASQADTVTTAELNSAVDGVGTTIEQRIAAVTAVQAGSTPVVNAAQLDGLTADAFARAETATTTGHVNCIAHSMGASLPGQKWNVDKFGLYQTAGDVGYFNCPIHLPEGATVTALRAAVRDNSTTGQIACYLLALSTAWPEEGYAVAFTPYSGDTTTPGDTMLVDDTMKDPVVDSSKWAYYAECELTGTGTAITLRAISVEYMVGG